MKVLFFPEGKRHSGNTLIPFKKGPFHLAITSQVPILPVIVSKYFFLNSKSKIFGSGTVIFLLFSFSLSIFHLAQNIVHLLCKSYDLIISLIFRLFFFFFIPGTSYITILPPIPTKGLTKDDIQELMDKSYDAMNTVFVQTSQETLTKHMESLKNE